MVPAAAWLLLLLTACSPRWTSGEMIPGTEDGGEASQFGQCFHSASVEAGSLNLGQRWGDPSPTATLYIDLQTVTSATSSFDFRTFDSEGVIFYGDTSPNVDWFILALRKGKPEMQIHNTLTNITVSGGRRLDDGQWHRIMVKNEGHSIVLEVDGDDHLTLSHVSHPIVNRPTPLMRIGVGGILISLPELLAPLNPALDGCMRRWDWLNKSLEWREGASLEARDTKVCFAFVQRGSFFPGDGLATFALPDLPTGLNQANGNWSLLIQMQVRAAPQQGTLVAVAPWRQSPVLHLSFQHTDLTAQLGNRTVLLLPLPAGGCLDAPLLLRITRSFFTLRLGHTEVSKPTPNPDFESLQRIWLGGTGSLAVGGLAGQEESQAAQEGSFFRGCLRALQVQGRELDLDAAQHRTDSIWAHSCPWSGQGQGPQESGL